MSTVLTTSFISKTEVDELKIFENLYSWLQAETNLYKTSIFEFIIEQRVIELKSLDLKTIINSKSAICAEFSYEIPPFEFLGSDIQFYGKKYELGFPRKNDGPVNIHLNANDVFRSMRQFVEEKDFEQIEKEHFQILHHMNFIFNEWVEVCGESLLHSGFYIETGLPSAFTCSMIFHSSWNEIINDFFRAYIFSRTAEKMPELYLNFDSHFKDLDNEPIQNRKYYESFKYEESDSNLIGFLELLNFRDLRKLISYKGSIKELVKAFTLDNPYIIFSERSHGITIATYPMNGLWPLYYMIWKKIVEI